MAREVAIGKQRFDDIRTGDFFLVDKTAFIRTWWRGGDDVTLVCRPRRFGKTLTLSMVECFLSTRFAGRGEDLFGGLDVWKDDHMRALQGTVPVVMVTFADCKGESLEESLAFLRSALWETLGSHRYLLSSDKVDPADKTFLAHATQDMDKTTAATCLRRLCRMLEDHWGKKPIVLLDEYDTPMQEALPRNYWDGMSTFMRQLFNSTFKTNPALGRALVTGITRVASESIFSDMNNPNVVTTTSPEYADTFGFTESEVSAALAEFGLEDEMADVRRWYDGFTFGGARDIYNPWSITNLLQKRVIAPYWANTSSNELVSDLVLHADGDLKPDFEALLAGNSVVRTIDESVHFRALDSSPDAVWSLLLAAGYLRVVHAVSATAPWKLELRLTNREVRMMFDSMVRGWFMGGQSSYNSFVRALLACDVETMNDYLADVAEGVMSSFDSGTRPSRRLPERFWHGLVLGLVVDLRGRYDVRSQPESGLGRCDVLLCPLDGPDGSDLAFVLEFKVVNGRRGESTLEDALDSALSQIANKDYDAALIEQGIATSRIRHLGIAFQGKEVLVGQGC